MEDGRWKMEATTPSPCPLTSSRSHALGLTKGRGKMEAKENFTTEDTERIVFFSFLQTVIMEGNEKHAAFLGRSDRLKNGHQRQKPR